ncbi:putative MFS family arabinose efflux permease [Scopulibacillus darangshiensis]|uniref:Putative MFS family arabinose efflux permease n=1 Tax=Scopulibacillus darangshiensis TaxID=442528 RepID=A0A4R2NWG7_9BACL|nr:MFS transporter [Scopulibacillus darangshiensis]TCP25968.1 putative MFS family arabinose efflux permease [Scopulibacillus darangshiensis]
MNQMKSIPQSKLWTKNFILIVIANLFTYQGFQMLIPTLPVYIKDIGGSDFQASLVVSLFALSALIFRSITGKAVDTAGRKPLLIIGFIILIFFNLTFFAFSAVALLLVLRLFQGVGWGMASTSIATVMSDNVPDQRRGEGTGYYALSVILATSVAPIIGIALLNHYSFNVILILTTVFMAIGWLITQGVSIPKLTKQEQQKQTKKGSIWSDLFEKKALLPSVLCFLLAVPFGGVMSFIALYGKEIGIESIWIYFIGHCLMILISRPFVGKLFDRKGHAFVVLPGAVCMLAGLIVLSFTTTIPTLVIASILYGFGFGSVQPSLQAWAVDRSASDRKGAANGTFLSFMDLGVALGAVLLSTIAAAASYAIMYRVSSLCMVLFLIIYGVYLLKQRRSHDQTKGQIQAVNE